MMRPDEQLALAWRESRDPEQLGVLYASLLGQIRGLVARWVSLPPAVDREDLVQQAYEWLGPIVDGWEPERRSLRAEVFWRLRHRIRDQVGHYRSGVERGAVSLGQVAEPVDQADELGRVEHLEQIAALLAGLAPWERALVRVAHYERAPLYRLLVDSGGGRRIGAYKAYRRALEKVRAELAGGGL